MNKEPVPLDLSADQRLLMGALPLFERRGRVAVPLNPLHIVSFASCWHKTVIGGHTLM